jgi:hypothetical protein
MQLEEFEPKFRVLCRGMKEFFDLDLLDAYYLALGSLTLPEFEWLVARVLSDTSLKKLPAAPALLAMVIEARQDHAENVTIAGLLARTPESIERERAEARQNARRGLELVKAAYAAAMPREQQSSSPPRSKPQPPPTTHEPAPENAVIEARRAERLELLRKQAEQLKQES